MTPKGSRAQSIRPWKVLKPGGWDKFLEAVESARKSLGVEPPEECFFRGHADRGWGLQPTLFRHARSAELSDRDTVDLESDLFWEFQARAQELHSQRLSDWDYLFFMRHHGVITRLLDWTETLGVAVYFALERHRAGTADAVPCIWLLNTYALNEHPAAWEVRDLVSPGYLGYIEKDDETYDYGVLVDQNWFHWEMPVAIYPIQRSNRVRAQRGWFTVHGTDQRPLEIQAPANVARVLLPPGAIADAERFLDQAGLNEYTLFADLDASRANCTARTESQPGKVRLADRRRLAPQAIPVPICGFSR
ncbi:MAG: FRG domain-containing protein [Bryobacteraceae bacterium]|jgi:hypothetical protein